MKKRLIKFSEHTHEAEMKYARKDLATYNKLVTDIRPYADELKLKLDKQTVGDLINNPKEFAFDKLVGSNPLTIGGAPISKKKAMEFVDMPDAWAKIIKLVEGFNQHLLDIPYHKENVQDTGGVNRINLAQMNFVKGEFTLCEDFTERIRNKHSVFTQNEKQNEAHDHLLRIYESFDKLKELGLTYIPDLENIGITFQYGSEETRVIYDPAYVLKKLK